MPTVAAPGIASLDAVWTQQGQFVENTFHYHKGTAWTLGDLEGICNSYIAWASPRSGLWNDDCSLVKLYARDLTSGASASVEVVPPVGIHGTDASGALPNNVTWALKRLTGLAGRANRGRLYMIGLAHDMLGADQQTILTAQAGTFRTNYDALLTSQLSDNGATEVILHRSLGTGTPVTEYGWSDFFLDSQRRRLPGHNRHH